MRGNGRRGVTRRCAGDPEREERASKSESAPDPVKRDFSADGPNKARFAGIAHVRTHRGWLCPAAAMGARSRRVAGRPMAPGMTAEPAGDALETAMARRGPEGGRPHRSDRGSRCMSLLIGKTVEEGGIAPSTGSVSSPRGNAVTESLTGVVKAECAHARAFSGGEEAALETSECMERFCNRIGIRSAPGWLGPERFEKKQREESRSKAA